MANMIGDAASWLAQTLESSAGESVTYVRGATSIAITASYGRRVPSRAAVMNGAVNLEVEPMDFLIRPSAIDFGAGAVDPARGDRITLATGEVFEVAPRDGEPAWRLSDPFGHMLRIRTIRES